jgi:hypothetical protein
MPTLRLLLALALVGSPAVAGAQQRERRPPDTDQTVSVSRGARLTIDCFAGEVVIRSEARDTLRVTARHSSRNKVEIRNTASGVTVQSHGSMGPASVDYEITVPSWMPVKVAGTYIFVSIEGTASEVSAETVRGDIVIKGGTGFVSAKSIEGEVIVEGSRGKVSASSVNEGIRITGASGDIAAETTNGDISLAGIESQSVEVATVNGDIVYEGTVAPAGRYRFTTHNGDVTLGVPEATSATFTVRTYNGEFETNLGLKRSGEVRRGRPATYVMGAGAAEVEIESFGGSIQVRRAGTLPPGKGRGKERAPEPETPDQLETASLLERSPVAGGAQPRAVSVF